MRDPDCDPDCDRTYVCGVCARVCMRGGRYASYQAQFVDTVPLLAHLPPRERASLARALVEEGFAGPSCRSVRCLHS